MTFSRSLLFVSLLTLALGNSHATTPRLLVVNKSGDSISALDTVSGRLTKQWLTAVGPHEIVVSPNAQYAVASEYGNADIKGTSLLLIDFSNSFTSKRIKLNGHFRPHGLAWLRDSKRVAVTSESSKKLLIVDVEKGQILQAINTDQASSHMLAIDHQRQRAYVSSIVDGNVAVIDLQAGNALHHIRTGSGAEGIAVHPNGEVWVSNRDAGTISVISPLSLSVIEIMPGGDYPIRVVFNADGRFALVSDAKGGAVIVYDTATKKAVGKINLTGYYSLMAGRMLGGWLGKSPFPIGILGSPFDSNTAYVSATDAGVVLELDLAKMAVSKEWVAGNQPDGLAIIKADGF